MTRDDGLGLDRLLLELAAFNPRVAGSTAVRVRDVCQDSRRVGPGGMFVARSGAVSDGARYMRNAVSAGAVAIMGDASAFESYGGVKRAAAALSVCVVEVSDVVLALAIAAEAVQGFPSRQLKLVGVTGTNGKTTTASLVVQVLQLLGIKTAQLGTLGLWYDTRNGRVVRDLGMTTPPADEVSRFLAEAVTAGCEVAVMEVSSHALEQRRVDALSFEVAAFSNLTQDHLDYHDDFEAYGEAKSRLFQSLRPRQCVINVDDAFGARLLESLSKQPASRQPGLLGVSSRRAAGVRLRGVTMRAQSSELDVETPSGRLNLSSSLVGDHNVDNWLLSIGILVALGCEPRDVARVGPLVSPAPGRMERCEQVGDDITVLVDYAHTPDALERALATARQLAARHHSAVLCVFGCGGDRDKGKRPQMGAVVARCANQAFITNDNPRTESPEAIAWDIEGGMAEGNAAYEILLDREAAIHKAIEQAQPHDVVLIAGKGHEDYQLIGDQRLSFDDRVVARNALAERRRAVY